MGWVEVEGKMDLEEAARKLRDKPAGTCIIIIRAIGQEGEINLQGEKILTGK